MPRIKQGGTKKWCPDCKEIKVCAAIPLSSIGEDSSQRLYMTNDPDINFFQRALECQECYNTWLTAEVEESYLYELINLRSALKEIKANAEKFQMESDAATVTLKMLSDSLSVLKALE